MELLEFQWDALISEVRSVLDRDRYLLQTMDEGLRKIMDRLNLDIKTAGRRLDGLDDKRLRTGPKVWGSDPAGKVMDQHCGGVPY